MVWASISYGQRTQLHFINGTLNVKRYCDEILRPIVVPFIRRHHLMFQHDNVHCCMSQGSLHNSWKQKMSQFFHGLHTHLICHPLSMFGMLWINVYDSVFQFPSISSNSAQPLKRRQRSTGHNQQPDQLYVKKLLCCMRQIVVTTDTDWFSDPRPYFFF